jgi:hypothetical protein
VPLSPRRLLSLAAPVLLVFSAGCGSGDGVPAAGPGSGWERLPDGPLGGRVGATVVGLGEDRVVVVGGWEWLCPPGADCGLPDVPMRADGAVVDLRTGEWRAIADAPYGFTDAVAAESGGELFVLTACRVGPGCDGSTELLRYDVAADRWSTAAAPGAGRGSALVPVGPRLLAVSGSDERGDEHPDRLYDPRRDRWEYLPDDPLPEVFDRFAVVDGDRVLVFGSIVDSDTKLAASYDLGTRAWTRLPDAPSHGYQAWPVGREVWLNGHFGNEGGAVLDLETDTWRALPDGNPDDQGDLAGVVGAEEASYEYDHGWVRDVVADRWVEIPDHAPTTSGESVAAVGSDLVVIGGQDWGRSGDDGRLVDEAWVWRLPG